MRLGRPIVFLLVLVLSGWLPAAAAAVDDAGSARPCHRYDRVAEHLLSRYGERPVGGGLQADGRLLQIFASPSGSWTVVSTSPAGRSCIVAAGRGWEETFTLADAI